MSINKEIPKELEEDSDFELSSSIDKLHSDIEDTQWVSTNYTLIIPS